MKILIVENDVNSRVFLERALLSQGYTVEGASNGVEALKKAEQSPPDLIISDILMPEMDGFELCRRVKTDGRLQNIPFVFYTATYTEKKDEDLAISLGASRFLIKPMEPEAFFNTIREVIEEHAAGHLPVPDRLHLDIKELNRMQLEALARKLDKKVWELEQKRKQFQRVYESLKLEKTYFEQLFRNSPEAIVIGSVEGRVVNVNEEFCQLFAYTNNETYEKLIDELIVPEAFKNEATSITNRVAKGERVFLETIRQNKHGKQFNVSLLCQPIIMDNKVIGVYGIYRDITERKRAEAALIESRERFRKLFEESNVSIIIHDKDTGEVIDANKNAIKSYGFSTLDEMKHNEFWMEPPYSFKEALEWIRKASLEGPQRFEWCNRKITGEIFWEDVRLSKIIIDGVERILATAIDITKRKHAEEDLRKRESLFKEAEKIAHLGSWEIDLISNSLIWSDEVYRIFGVKPHEFPVTYEAFLGCVHPDDRTAVDAAYSGSLRERKDSYEIEHRIIKKDTGEIRYVHEKCIHIKDKKGEIVKSVGMVHDITERKLVEEELQRYKQQLERLVEERTAQLKAANKELEAFAYSVSHDLRAPLRAIDGFTEILQKEYSQKLDEEGKRICKIITNNTKKMGQLIDELLALSRIGRIEMHFMPIDIKHMVDEVYKELTTEEMRQKIEFRVRELRDAYGDATLIKQVWMNLIGNAIKFTSYREKPIIEVICKEEDGRLVYSVHDNGAGFNMSYADKLFKVFQRLHSEKEFPGTGVGLAIVHRIIQRHEGEVWAEGEVDKGATFYFSLPFRRQY